MTRSMPRPFLRLTFCRLAFPLLVLSVFSGGCSGLIRSQATGLFDGLGKAMLSQTDVELVRQGAPSYMLLLDGQAIKNPDDPGTLFGAAKLYTLYAAAFGPDDKARERSLARKARDYAVRASSIGDPKLAPLIEGPAAAFDKAPARFDKGDEDKLATLVNAWALDLRARGGSPEVMAELPKVRLLAERLIELDPDYGRGSAQVLVGTLKTLLTPTLGGKPDEAKAHFERAITASSGANLSAKVALAAKVAKPSLDRATHDALLKDVLAAKVDQIPELAFFNTLAKREAEKLLSEADAYF